MEILCVPGITGYPEGIGWLGYKATRGPSATVQFPSLRRFWKSHLIRVASPPKAFIVGADRLLKQCRTRRGILYVGGGGTHRRSGDLWVFFETLGAPIRPAGWGSCRGGCCPYVVACVYVALHSGLDRDNPWNVTICFLPISIPKHR